MVFGVAATPVSPVIEGGLPPVPPVLSSVRVPLWSVQPKPEFAQTVSPKMSWPIVRFESSVIVALAVILTVPKSASAPTPSATVPPAQLVVVLHVPLPAVVQVPLVWPRAVCPPARAAATPANANAHECRLCATERRRGSEAIE